jgi:predicted ester cyclase
MSVTTLEDNKAIIQDWIDEVFNEKDMTAIDKLKVSSYLDWTPFPNQRLDLPVSGLKHSLPSFIRSFPDFHFTADQLIAEGDFVACLGHWHATHTDEFMGIAPTGKEVGGTRIDIFRVVGDKMVEHWGCGNELRFLRMLNAIRPTEPRDTSEKDNKSVARRFVDEVLNQRNLAAVEELVETHALDHSNLALNLYFVITGFPDFHVDIEDVLAEDDKVTVISTFSGTHHGEFMGIPPTGKPVTEKRLDLFRIADGQIVESWQDWDTQSLVAQIRA